MRFTYYGHSCFALEHEGTRLLIDPFISANPKAAAIRIQDIEADYILLSHGHADHILDAEAIAMRTGACVISTFEIHEWLQAKGVQQTHPMNIGGARQFGPVRIKCTVAQHSSVLPDGTYGGNPMGFLISFGDEHIYYSGDTALTMDMQLIPMWAQIKAAVLPVGDNFTMGLDDAVIAATWVKAPKVIGVHFDTFGWIEIDHEAARQRFADKGIPLYLPAIGEQVEF